MANQSVYTSVPQGLWSGAGGYATVLSTEAIPRALAEFLEGLSTYSIRDQYKGETISATQKNYELLSSLNPPSVSYMQFKYRGDNVRVLARTCLAGFDYSKRLRKLSHFLVMTPNDLTDAGPAWLASQDGIFLVNWGGTPTLLREEKALPKGQLRANKCPTWHAKTGDAGWAGALAKSALDPQAKNAYVVVSNPADLMPLFIEATALLPADRRWNCTFSTLYAELPLSVECKWRGIVAGTPEHRALASVRNALVIDTTKQLPSLEPSLEVACARGGREIPEQQVVRAEVSRFPEPEVDFVTAYVEQPKKYERSLEPPAKPALIAPPVQIESVERVPQYPDRPASTGESSFLSFSFSKLLLFMLVLCMPVVGLITLTFMYTRFFPVTLVAKQMGTIDLSNRKTPDFDLREYVQGQGDLPLQVTKKTVTQTINQRPGDLWAVDISKTGDAKISLLNNEYVRLPEGSRASLVIDLSVRVDGKPSNELPLHLELIKEGKNEVPQRQANSKPLVVTFSPEQTEEMVDVLTREGWKDVDTGAKLRVSQVFPLPPLTKDHLTVVNNNQIQIRLPQRMPRSKEAKYKIPYEVMDEKGGSGTSEFVLQLLPYPPVPKVKDVYLFADASRSFTVQQLVEDPSQDLRDWDLVFRDNREQGPLVQTDRGGTLQSNDRNWTYLPPQASVASTFAASGANDIDSVSYSLRHKNYEKLVTERRRISFDRLSELESVIAKVPKLSVPNYEYLPRISLPPRGFESSNPELLTFPPSAAASFDGINLNPILTLVGDKMVQQREGSEDPRVQIKSLFQGSKRVLSIQKQDNQSVNLSLPRPGDSLSMEPLDLRETLAGCLLEIPVPNLLKRLSVEDMSAPV